MSDTPKQSPKPFTHKVSKKRVGVFEINENSICDAEGDILIAENYVPNYDCDCEGDFISLAPGDWHLFAAAPEMLAVLQGIHDMLIHDVSYEGRMSMRSILQAAIAKAEGRQE